MATISNFIFYLAATSGKYIFKEVITHTDAPEGTLLLSVWARGRSAQEPLAMIPHQRPTPEGQTPAQTETTESEQTVILRSPNAASKVQKDLHAAASILPPSIEHASSSVSVSPLSTGKSTLSPIQWPQFRDHQTRNTSWSSASIIMSRAATPPAVLPSVCDLETESTTTSEKVEERTDGQTSTEAVNDEIVQMQPVVIADPVDNQLPLRTIDNETQCNAFKLESRTIRSVTDRWDCDSEEEEDDDSPQTLPQSGAGVFIDPVRPETISQLGSMLNRLSLAVKEAPAVALLRRLKATQKSKVRRVVNDRVAKLHVQRRQVDKNAVSRQGITEEMVKSLLNEKATAMSGLEFSERAKEQEEFWKSVKIQTCHGAETEGEMVGLEFGIIDEPMIGSDVEAEMEIDEETSNSEDDGGCVAGDAMQVEEDKPEVQRRACNSGFKARQSPRERRKDRLARLQGSKIGKRALAPRRVAKKKANRGDVSSSLTGSAHSQPSQQKGTPAIASGPATIYTNMPQGVPQHLISTNSAADLREARLGKRPASATTSVVETVAQDGAASDTTPPSTAVSTLVSSAASTPPASAKPTPSVPGKQAVKRGCEDSDDGAEKGKVVNHQEPLPTLAPSKVPAARKILLDKPAKRNVRANRPGADKAAAVNKSEASGPSSASEPTTDSSKRRQQERPKSAHADEEVVPLNEVAEKALTEEQKTEQYLDAAWELFDHSDDDDD